MDSEREDGEVVEIIKLQEGTPGASNRASAKQNNFMSVGTVHEKSLSLSMLKLQEDTPGESNRASAKQKKIMGTVPEKSLSLSTQSTVAINNDDDTSENGDKDNGVIECMCAVCFNTMVCCEPSCSPPCDEPGKCNFNCPISSSVGNMYYHSCVFCSICCCGWFFTIPLNIYCFYQLKICEICFWPSAVKRARRNRVNIEL